jgi:hypothetical protein
MGSSKNTLTTTLKKIGRLDKIIALSVLIIVMNSVCIPHVLSCRELGRPIFPELVGRVCLASQDQFGRPRPNR